MISKGDWYVHPSGTIRKAEYEVEKGSFIDLDCKPWEPKEKEWVVCIVSSIKNMFGVFQYEEDLYNDIKDMNPDDIVTIQPFVGQLPSDLKENR